MIVSYHRPETISEALELLSRTEPMTVPLGGGTVLSRSQKHDLAVVDVQRLGLDSIRVEGQLLHLGAAATLQQLFEFSGLPFDLHGALQESLLLEGALNNRQMASIAGTIVACDGMSPFVTALLALDPRLLWAPKDDGQPLGDYLPLREEFGRSRLLLEIRMPVNARLRFSAVGRSPLDRPVAAAAVAVWPSGRTRVSLGGFGNAPILAMDGPEPGGAVVAAREAFRFASDAFASAEYRMDAVGRLVQRMVADLMHGEQAAQKADAEG